MRLAARLLDPDAFVICCAILKTHNTVVATLSIKNMALGAPLHSARAESNRWNDKRLFHGGVRQTHVDIMKRLGLKDRIKAAFEALPEQSRADVGGLDVHDFIRTYLLKGGDKV